MTREGCIHLILIRSLQPPVGGIGPPPLSEGSVRGRVCVCVCRQAHMFIDTGVPWWADYCGPECLLLCVGTLTSSSKR